MIIKIPYEGKIYRVGFTRDTAKQLEASGFNSDELSSKIVTMLPKLVQYAFRAYHPKMSPGEAEKIWSAQKGKTKLMMHMVESYAATINTLLDSDEGNQENAEWEIEV